MQLETQTDIHETILFVDNTTQYVKQERVSRIYNLMKLLGYKNLSNHRVAETAFKDIINQVKYN